MVFVADIISDVCGPKIWDTWVVVKGPKCDFLPLIGGLLPHVSVISPRSISSLKHDQIVAHVVEAEPIIVIPLGAGSPWINIDYAVGFGPYIMIGYVSPTILGINIFSVAINHGSIIFVEYYALFAVCSVFPAVIYNIKVNISEVRDGII